MSSWSPSTPSSSLPLGSEGGSHLLSQSLPSPDPFDASSHIHTGPRGADLSLSELSLSDKPYGPRFSLLAPPPAPPRFSTDQSAILESDECEEGDISIDEHDDANHTMTAPIDDAKAREAKLQSDLSILRKLNESFAVLNDALQATKGATEQVAAQLSQTDALLDKYANMLAKSETVTRLIFDERWEGADADEATLAKAREEEALEQARLEREREEAARREAEERAQREAEEAAKREAEARAKQEAAVALATKAPAKGRGAGSSSTSSSGVRGVRGTRATASAMASRGGRGAMKTVSTSTSGIPRARSASATGSISSSGGVPRPSSSASRESHLSRGVPRRG